MQNFSDERLALLIRDGDASQKCEAWGFIYERYGPRLQLYARTFLNGDAHRSHDVVQTAMLAFYIWALSCDKPRCVAAKLYSITRYECLQIFRKKDNGHSPLTDEMVDRTDFPGHENHLSNLEKKRLIRMFLFEGGLTKFERQVWKLRDLHDFPITEVSHILGKTSGNVSVTLHYARRKWHRFLDGLRGWE